MASSINNNVSSLSTNKYLGIANKNAEKIMKKLASGLKINSAADDAAGLAISEKMRGQISGYSMAIRNTQDSSSLLQVADGALSQSHSITQRMRELALQATNPTYTDDDRSLLNIEFDQLKKELDRIGNTTEFNTQKLLNGSFSGVSDAVGSNFTLNNNSQMTFDLNNMKVEGGAWNYDGMVSLVKVDDSSFKVTFHNESDSSGESVTLTGYGEAGGAAITPGSAVGDYTATEGKYGLGKVTLADGSEGELSLSISDGGVDGQNMFVLELLQDGVASTLSFSPEGFEAGNGSFESLLNEWDSGEGFTLNFTASQNASGSIDNSLSSQVGANTGQTTVSSMGDMRSNALGLGNTNILTADSAQAAIAEIDNAIKQISSQRGSIGATQNRLEYTGNALAIANEKTQAAESRLRDADLAKEMSELMRENLKVQAAQAMQVHGNARAQKAINLLK